jgi:hypothetical protein
MLDTGLDERAILKLFFRNRVSRNYLDVAKAREFFLIF